MTKAEIVNEISNRTGYEKNSVQTIVEAFMESVKRSAPYFDLRIDGITLLNEKF